MSVGNIDDEEVNGVIQLTEKAVPKWTALEGYLNLYNYSKAFIIDNCNKCNFSFNVKVKAISAIKCRGSKLIIKQGLVSSFEVMHSKKMEI